MSFMRRIVPGAVRRYLGSLRFPQLFVITAILFAVNVAVPDALPFIDEILLALGSLLLGSLREKVGDGRDGEGTDGERELQREGGGGESGPETTGPDPSGGGSHGS